MVTIRRFPELLMQRPSRTIRSLSIPGCIASSLLLAGCVTTKPVAPAPAASASMPSRPESHSPGALPPGFVPVMRQGRYTLVELTPDLGQRDLMLQIVDVRVPSTFDATVADAIRYVLLRSGYRLCDSSEIAPLYALSLPAVHIHLGPQFLREALLTLAGPAWELSIDDASRTVCFSQHVEPATPALTVATTAPRGPSLGQAGVQQPRFDLHQPQGARP